MLLWDPEVLLKHLEPGRLETPGSSLKLLHDAECGEARPDALLPQTQPSTFPSTWIPESTGEFVIFLPCHQPCSEGWALCTCSSFSLTWSSQKQAKLTSPLPPGPGAVLSPGLWLNTWENLSASLFTLSLTPSHLYFSIYCQLFSFLPMFFFFLCVYRSFLLPSFLFSPSSPSFPSPWSHNGSVRSGLSLCWSYYTPALRIQHFMIRRLS